MVWLGFSSVFVQEWIKIFALLSMSSNTDHLNQGLNAILDHRAEVFIPELGHTYKCPPSFRVFACQNPSHQGGGRKGLPRSFLNRFTKVGWLTQEFLYLIDKIFSFIFVFAFGCSLFS